MVLRGATQISIMARMATRKTKKIAIKKNVLKKNIALSLQVQRQLSAGDLKEKKEVNSIQPP